MELSNKTHSKESTQIDRLVKESLKSCQVALAAVRFEALDSEPHTRFPLFHRAHKIVLNRHGVRFSDDTNNRSKHLWITRRHVAE